MKKIFSFAKKKKSSTGTPDNGSVLSVGYELKDKDLGKVHKAASVGDLAKLKQLATKQKNDLNQLDKENRTALHIACAAGHVDVVQFLVESKAKLNLCDNQIRSALMKAVQGQHDSCAVVLLENHADPNLVDINGNTALHLAASIPSVTTARLLLEHEAHINALNKEGLSPLSVSVREDHIEMAEFLLKEGADVNSTDNTKRSPLMMAAGNGQYDMLQLLLRCDADITLKDDREWTADDYATNNGHHACSHLIDNHATQKSDGASLLHQDQGKTKKKTSGASQRTEAGLSLGGPAIDKDDFEDDSQSESVSRISKSADDDWSSDNDDDSPVIQKEPKKYNLRQMFASKAGAASAQLDASLSGVESEPEPEIVPQNAPRLPKALPSTSARPNPVDPRPESLLFKPPRMSSTPRSGYNKKEILTDGDSDQNEDESDQDEEEEEESEEEGEEPEESDLSHDAASTIPETDWSKDKRRDFLSELGLEKEEPVQYSWDSESDLDDASLRHGTKENRNDNQEELSTVKEEKEEINGSDATEEQDKNDQGESLQKETEKTKWEPLLNKLEGVSDQKTDLMEELGLGDADDLADASDWDSVSTTSKQTLPGGRRMPSPGIEEFPESPEPPKKEEVTGAAAPVTPQRSFNSRNPSTASASAPRPQPRARKMPPHKSESQDESDWDSDQMMEEVYQQTLDERDSSEPKAAKRTESAAESAEACEEKVEKVEKEVEEEREEPVERDADAVDVAELAVDAPLASDPPEPGSDDDDHCTPSDQDRYEEREETADSPPWEKRYENLWVEVEKQNIKTTYKSITAELKARFGEVFKSRRGENEEEEAEEEEDIVEPAPETSSDEDEGEVDIRPIARARLSSRLLTIPEQRESGLEDSESAENSMCDDSRYEQDKRDAPAGDEENDEDRLPMPQPRKNTNAKRDGSFPRPVSQDVTEEEAKGTTEDVPRSFIDKPQECRTSSPSPLDVNAPIPALNVDDDTETFNQEEELEDVSIQSRIAKNRSSSPPCEETIDATSSITNQQEEYQTRVLKLATKLDSDVNNRSLDDGDPLNEDEDMSSGTATSKDKTPSPPPVEVADTKPEVNADHLSVVSDMEAFEQDEQLRIVSQENRIRTSSPPPIAASDAKSSADPFLGDLKSFKDCMKPPGEVDDCNGSLEEDNQDFVETQAPLTLSRRSVSGVSDDELEEDMERFKQEVGMLKVVFWDLEREKAQLRKEARKSGSAATAAAERGLSTSRDSRGNPTEDAGSEKPEPAAEFREELTTQTAPQEHKPVSNKRTNGAAAKSLFPLQQMHSSRKDQQAAQEPKAPPPAPRLVNGNPLSVFDDSSLSDVSEDEGRTPKQVKKPENSEELEMADDFDDLTQSSDTATEDLDSASAGYRHAALLVDKLDSTCLDSRNMVKLQNIFHEYEHTIQRLKIRHSYLSDKVNQLEMERVDMKNTLEEIKDVKSTLERNQLELQTEVTNIKFQLKQEQENRRNATMMYNSTKDKLKRTEEQQQLEVQEKQKVELTLRNLELEMRTLLNNMKQLEEDHSETQRLLAQERSARALQENLLNSHLRKQQEIEVENKRNLSKSNEALSQLTEASDRERELQQQTSTLQEQLSILRADLEHAQANSSLKESHLLEENENLKDQLEDARREVKANSEALTQTVFNCNNQLTTLKSELAITTNRFENEKQAREALEREIESTRTRLTGAVQEAERCMAANADTEKALLREKEESQRLKDRLTAEGASHREAVSSLTQKLSKTEAQANSLENEVHRVTLQLTEKGLLLDVLQKEKDQLAAQVKELDKSLQTQKELATKTGARHEATQERLAQAQSETMLLRQQLEEANNKGDAKEKAVTDAQERFSDMLSKLRSDSEERVQLVEERNKELASKAADLRDQVYKLEEDKNDREANLRQLQQELADSLKKLSMSEASLEVNTRYRNDLEEEKVRIFKDLDRLKDKLTESEDQYVQAEKCYNSLKSSCDEKEKELAITTQRLQEALSASATSAATIKQLEEAVQRLEIENARLEAAAKQQANKIEALQKGAHEAAMVRGHLEELVTNLQSSKMSLEDQLGREVQKQSMLSHTAQDSQALWEQEAKSRSKLGLRLSELEKEKGELASQMEIEKKKVKKIAEQKKAADARLDQEMNRNSELQKEMYRLRTLLKTAKKKLRDQEVGAEFNSPMNSLRMDMARLSQDPRKADDLQVQLDREALRRSQLEKDNNDLREELSSLKRSGQNSQRLEEELQELRRQMEATQREQSQAEERARHELQNKLEQVNIFLQSQAASHEALDQLKAANQASVQSQLEQRIRELESEVSRARSTQQDSLSQRESSRSELERYRSMYSEELRLRKSLAAKLERANTRLSEANSKLLSERSKSLIGGSFVNSSALGGSLGSSPGSLGLSLLSPVTPGPNRGVEDYLAKMRSELDRNISKELRSGTAELDLASVRLSPVGSAGLDPVSRAAQDYLTVLQKNYNVGTCRTTTS